jgi:hypothetical protein
VSPSRDLVPLPRPAARRQPRWRTALDATGRLLARTARSPLTRRVALTVLLAILAVGFVSVSYATTDAPAVPTRPAGKAATGPGTPRPGAAATAGERHPGRRPTPPPSSADRTGKHPGAASPGTPRRQPPVQPGGTVTRPDATAPGPRRQPPAHAGGLATGSERAAERAGGPVRRGAGPGGVAVAWYAGRLGVPVATVRALASQQPGPGRVRVLVAAEVGPGRLATAWVTLARTPGGWTVTP